MDLEGRPAKSVVLPVFGTVDIKRVQPLVDHPIYQRLRYRLQTGGAHVAYPGAGHNRLEHSLGVGKWSWRRARRWLAWGQITAADALAIEDFGYVHDVGHGPESHITDPLVREGHEARALKLLDELSSEIEQCGMDLGRLKRMMQRTDPLAMAVLQTPYGTDKLAYLASDAHHIGIGGMPAEGVFLDHVYWIDGQLVADAKIFEDVRLLVHFYQKMYARVYFRTSVVLTERYIQRMISILLGQTGDEPAFNEQELVMMKDGDLGYHLSYSRNPTVRREYDCYMRRRQPMPAIEFQLAPFQSHNWSGDHPSCHVEAPEELFNNAALRDPSVLYRVERAIEQAVNLPIRSVLVVPPVPARRFEPQNIPFLTDGGIVPLKEFSPTMWEAQVQDARRHASIHVGTYLEQCPRLSEKWAAKLVLEILLKAAVV